LKIKAKIQTKKQAKERIDDLFLLRSYFRDVERSRKTWNSLLPDKFFTDIFNNIRKEIGQLRLLIGFRYTPRY